MRHRIALGGERWNAQFRELPDLAPGQNLFLQNQLKEGNAGKI